MVLADHLPNLLVIPILEEVLKGYATQIVAGQEAQFVRDAVRVLQPHRMLLAAVISVTEPVGMRAFIVHDVGAALASAQGKDDLLARLERLAAALGTHLCEGRHRLTIADKSGIAALEIDAAGREDKLELLVLDLAHRPADQLVHRTVGNICLRVGQRGNFEHVNRAAQSGPLKGAGVPLVISDLSWVLGA